MPKQLSRREFLVLAAGTLSGAAVVACAPAPGIQSAAPASESATLNLWRVEGPIYSAMVKDYDAKNEKVKISATIIGDSVFGDQKFLPLVAGGTAPDAAVQTRHAFLQFAAQAINQGVEASTDKSGPKKAGFT